MNETQMLTLAAALVATMFGLLCAIIGWVGSRALNAIDEIRQQLGRMAQEIHEKIVATKDELHDRVTTMGERIAKLEALIGKGKD
jgi:biopolymer transport protein ExbB/TolQ